MAFPPVASDFTGYFVREFKYGDGADKVMPSDITRALGEASTKFRSDLWDTTTPVNGLTEGGIAYLYLTAFILDRNIKNAGGLSSINHGKGIDAQADGIITSKSIGGISINQEFCEKLKASPFWSQFLDNGFGYIYATMAYDRSMTGAIAVVSGRTPGTF